MFKRFAAALNVFVLPLVATTAAGAQGLGSAPLSKTPDQIEADSGRVRAVIDKSENHFRAGELHLKDKNFRAARAEFDKALNAVLESGLDVRANPRLQTYYLQLVGRIYRMEVPAQASAAPALVECPARRSPASKDSFGEFPMTIGFSLIPRL
jgi:hypothetical protein